MDGDALESFYENLGFELVEIDDRETLFYQIDDDVDLIKYYSSFF